MGSLRLNVALEMCEWGGRRKTTKRYRSRVRQMEQSADINMRAGDRETAKARGFITR